MVSLQESQEEDEDEGPVEDEKEEEKEDDESGEEGNPGEQSQAVCLGFATVDAQRFVPLRWRGLPRTCFSV